MLQNYSIVPAQKRRNHVSRCIEIFFLFNSDNQNSIMTMRQFVVEFFVWVYSHTNTYVAINVLLLQ